MTQPRHDDTKVVQALDGMMGGIAFLVSYDLKLFEVLGRGFQTARSWPRRSASANALRKPC